LEEKKKDALLEVKNLKVAFHSGNGDLTAVNGISLTLAWGEVLGLVGESGCGKSMAALSILRLLPQAGRIICGEVWLKGQDLLKFSKDKIRQVRGRKIAMILQDPNLALNPVRTIGRQFTETLRIRMSLSAGAAFRRAVEALLSMELAEPEKIMKCYPFQLSGGMRQRVMITMALAMSPEILIADEPTTALDVTVQAQILLEMKKLKDRLGTGILLISHNMGVIAQLADRVAVMYAGDIVEQGLVDTVFSQPAHPYTQALLRSIPKLEGNTKMLYSIKGQPPKSADSTAGCPFYPRCEKGADICRDVRPTWKDIGNGQGAVCFFPLMEKLKPLALGRDVAWR
jgi:oligopeptide/dipeptide ABC transporter ATP-binding protein